MAISHIAYKRPLDPLASTEWNAEHRPNFIDSTFHCCDILERAHTECYNQDQSSIPASRPQPVLENGHMSIRLHTTAAIDTISSMRHLLATIENNITNKLDFPLLQMLVKLRRFNNTGEVFNFGFMEYTQEPFPVNPIGAFFRVVDNQLQAVCGDGVEQVAITIGEVPVTANCRIEFTSTAVRFYIENMTEPVATITARIPTSDLTIKFSAKALGGIASIMHVDGVALVRSRIR